MREMSKGYPLKVAMIVTGFPSVDRPDVGIFNLRAAMALSHLVDIIVIRLRVWKPNRLSVESTNFAGLPLVTIAVPQIPGYSYFNLILYQYFGWPRVKTLLQKCNLIHSVDIAFAGTISSAWANWTRIHHVAQVTGSDISIILRRKKFSTGWEKHLHGVACNSRDLARAFSTLYPTAKNVHVIWRGVDLERFHPAGPVAGPLSTRSPVRYLFLGGFPSYPNLPYRSNTKGGKTLLAAWQVAESKLISSGASLLIAGPRSEVGSVVRWRANLRCPDQVYLAGLLDPDIIPMYMRSADVVLIPSLQEGLPNVAMEASACGRPVFGSNIGGMPEVVVDGETGLLLPAGDITAWQNALVKYAAQSDQLRTMGRHARTRMEALFDSRLYAPRMFDLYRTALCESLRYE